MNSIHLQWLNKIENSSGFTGTCGNRGISEVGSEGSVIGAEVLDAHDAEAENNDIDEDLAVFTDFVLGIQD